MLARLVEASEVTLHVPAVCDLELLSAVRRLVGEKRLTGARGDEAVAIYAALSISRHGHRRLLPRIWALRSNFTPYDASYLALAEMLDAPLVTTDARFARAARRLRTVTVLTP